MTVITVGEGTQVTLHFALKLETGEVVDSNFDGEAATFAIGDGNLLPGFERALFGMSAGQRSALVVSPEDAFGQSNPNNIQRVPRSGFTEEFELQVGLVVSFADASGGETHGVVTDLGESEVTVDFNHPLAGKSIIFDVSILDVQAAITH